MSNVGFRRVGFRVLGLLEHQSMYVRSRIHRTFEIGPGDWSDICDAQIAYVRVVQFLVDGGERVVKAGALHAEVRQLDGRGSECQEPKSITRMSGYKIVEHRCVSGRIS